MLIGLAVIGSVIVVLCVTHVTGRHLFTYALQHNIFNIRERKFFQPPELRARHERVARKLEATFKGHNADRMAPAHPIFVNAVPEDERFPHGNECPVFQVAVNGEVRFVIYFV
ncbi:unnamed protein product [Caenorhabditis bovis]|uniref:Uncharacterized protein n=1 Tax=Caenorhabditis bovis TaxID=2654633 RepID=A0A8S1EEM2_9PELO|nr:unnamed protein product [Caenorhabditis bovis]